MLKVAIVEDEVEYIEQIQDLIDEYCKEFSKEIQVTSFDNGEQIITDYKINFDIIFLDIEMPILDGMKTAEKIREIDKEVVLVFITNMAHYAINGYSVGAFDFILKPINYSTFSVRFTRAINRVRKRESGLILLSLSDGVKKIKTTQIYYVDVQNRMLHYHTDEGEYIVRGTLQNAEKELGKYQFVKCNHWYLVNLKYVSEIRKGMAMVAGNELEISRRNKTSFLTALTNYVGESV
ncbi:MAG: LytR/AlgR family response regulator transcription factor [Lachnotalea sp.]